MKLSDNELDTNLFKGQNFFEPTPSRDSLIAIRRIDKYLNEGKNLGDDNSRLSNTRLIEKNHWESLLHQKQSLIPFSIFIMLIVGLLFGSWRTAFAAMDSLPNDPLYSVKLIGEDLQLLLTSDSTARISLLITFANRRADEATILAWQGEPIPEKLTTRIDEYQEELATLSAKLADESLLEAIKAVGIHQRPQDRDLAGKESGTPPRNMALKNQPGTALEDQTTMTMIIDAIDLTTTVTDTLEVSDSLNITPTRNRPGYGPGPCEEPGTCTPPVKEDCPGPYDGTHPGPGNHEGYGPGSDQVLIPQQPPATSPPEVIDKSKQPANNKGNLP